MTADPDFPKCIHNMARVDCDACFRSYVVVPSASHVRTTTRTVVVTETPSGEEPEWFVMSRHAIAPYSSGARSMALMSRDGMKLLLGDAKYQRLVKDVRDHGSALLNEYFDQRLPNE